MRLLDLFVFKYNRTDFHELNLDWIISDMRTLAETLQNFISLNTIKYADPIQWNISTQYGTNTVVVDPNTGTAYLSVQPVPSGVAISNTDYWTPIFTLNFLSANQNITLRDDGQNILATFSSAADDWLIWQGILYKVTQAINVNEAYVPGYNITRYTVEMYIEDLKTALINLMGDLQDLNTTDKSNLVAAINEVLTIIGNLSDLNTTDKSNVVSAINEVADMADDLLEVNYKKASSFSGADDTAILQNAINGSKMLILDRDFNISSVRISSPIVFNLGGHKITSNTEDTNTIDIICSNVEIFNGEIYTTVNNPSNVSLFGSCIYVRRLSPNDIPIFNNINCHDLKLSTNGSQCICAVGEIYNSIFENIEFVGDRTNLDVNYSAISFEWDGTKHVLTYHPHDIIFNNIIIHGYKTDGGTAMGFRTSAAFNIKLTNSLIYDSDAAISIVSGDWGGEAARPIYKDSVNKNISVENVSVYNSRVAISVYGNTYPSGLIGFHAKNVVGNVNVAGIVSRYTQDSTYENVEIIGGNFSVDTNYEESPSYIKCNFHDCNKYCIIASADTHNMTIKDCLLYNINLSQGSGINLDAIYNGSPNAIISGNRILYKDNQYFTTSILNSAAGTKSIITDNIVACAITNNDTDSIVDNNIVI